MGMRVTTSSMNQTLKRFSAAKVAINEATEDAFAEVGEYVVSQIRSGGLSDWNNQTGAMRSSIGFGVVKRGQIVRSSDFATILNGGEGSQKGRDLLSRLATEYASCEYALIIVAGVEYAVYVEAMDNKVVLSSGWFYLKRTLPSLLKQRVNQALKRI